MKSIAAHGAGPSVISHDGSKTYGGLRCMKLSDDNQTLITGGADGLIQKWDISSGSISEESQIGE